jgi:hypothetical protein
VVRGRVQCQAPIDIVAEAHCGRTAIVLAQVYSYDVVVLPAALPDLSGVEVLQQLQARRRIGGGISLRCRLDGGGAGGVSCGGGRLFSPEPRTPGAGDGHRGCRGRAALFS